MEPALKLEIVPFSSFILIPFWHTLAKKKLEEYKLDDSARSISATYKISNYKENRANLYFDTDSLEPLTKTTGQVEVRIPGYLKNCNTAESFEAGDKFTLLEEQSLEFYKQLTHVAEHPEQYEKVPVLNTFLLVTFADLKHHLFKYSLASPIFKLEKVKISSRKSLNTGLSGNSNLEDFESKLRTFLLEIGNTPPVLFAELAPNETEEQSKNQSYRFFLSLSEYFSKLSDSATHSRISAVVFDSYNQENKYGEPIYNFILLNLLHRQSIASANKSYPSNLRLLVIKDFIAPSSSSKTAWSRSQLLDVDLSEAKIPEGVPKVLTVNSLKENKVVDLKTQLDERSLSTMAVDLNIKLMKWRLLPELDIEKVQKTRCLLFGAGTLGCQLARNLLGWGVRNISFVDYGRVTHSNPVRQSLYDFEDALGGGKPKAETAALKLAKIFPEINAKGYSLEVPMPGHYAESVEKQKQISETLNKLEELVESHDAIFLLTDNRESRWLPTVLANKYNKICITVGLGFDSYVIVRNGISSAIHNEAAHGERLGCYFCNDILSPHNSMKDRTLDQQCTVTRPGLSFISSAYASELLISLLHHPNGIGAKAYDPEVKGNEETCLGYLPQYLRGSCSEYENRIFVSHAFPNCVACSDYVLKEFCEKRDEFMIMVMNDPDYLQSVTKIADVLKETEDGECLIIEDDDF